MTTKKTYGPWIKWHGGECPVPPDTPVEVKFRDGDSQSGYSAYAYAYSWNHGGGIADIVEYRITIEQADLEAAEQLLRANDYTIIPPVKPLTFDDVVPMTEVPPVGTEFWIVSAPVEGGVIRAWVDGDERDSRVIKRRMAYLNKEHALVAARHIFGLKGGEL